MWKKWIYHEEHSDWWLWRESDKITVVTNCKITDFNILAKCLDIYWDNTIKLHYGNFGFHHFWIMTKSQDVSGSASSLLTNLKNLPLMNPQILSAINCWCNPSFHSESVVISQWCVGYWTEKIQNDKVPAPHCCLNYPLSAWRQWVSCYANQFS